MTVGTLYGTTRDRKCLFDPRFIPVTSAVKLTNSACRPVRNSFEADTLFFTAVIREDEVHLDFWAGDTFGNAS